MFAVQRFDISETSEIPSENLLESVIEKQKQRAKRKHTSSLGESFKTSYGETIEEKLARKAQAKLDKRERKASILNASSSCNCVDSVSKVVDTAVVAKHIDEVPKELPNTVLDVELPKHDVELPKHDVELINDFENGEFSGEKLIGNYPVLPEVLVPVEESVGLWGVRPDLAQELIAEGIKSYFPVQSAVIPVLLRHHQTHPFVPPRDICVSAPTGSGKTLAYALPIIQVLDSFYGPPLAQDLTEEEELDVLRARRLRALIILPSRELAAQVMNFSQGCITNFAPSSYTSPASLYFYDKILS